MSKLLLPLFLAISLSACQTTTGLIKPDELYPKELTDCSKEPVVKEREDKTVARPEDEKARYIVGLRSAYFDCRNKIEGWASRRDKYVKQYEAQHYSYFGRILHALSGEED